MSVTKTIAETITDIRATLQEYIEATYHVGHPALVAQRHDLLKQEGVLFRAPVHREHAPLQDRSLLWRPRHSCHC